MLLPRLCFYDILIAMQGKRKCRLNAEAILAIRATLKMVRAQLADDPYFKDVLAFDPELDVPQPAAEAKIRERMGDVAEGIGLAPDLAHAIRKTGLVVTDKGKHLLDDAQRATWNEAIDEYHRLAKRLQ
jgi:hypothetical protein